MLRQAREGLARKQTLTPTAKPSIKNPYSMGMQSMQKPPVNLGPGMNKPALLDPNAQKLPIIAKPGIDLREEYFAENAMKPMKPDMYSMRKNREADKYYQMPRSR